MKYCLGYIVNGDVRQGPCILSDGIINDQLYLDKALPFGLHSVPLIFTEVEDAMEWIIHQLGVLHIFHYVDDFILVGSPNSQDCGASMATALQTFNRLQVLIEPDKCEGPATTLTILGIEIDTFLMQLRLPEEKLGRLKESVTATCSL